jgi:LDH2 family malate/lactate/ureidoglycolate dehydrogenase
MAQNAIEMAEKGDFSEVQRLVTLLSRPFDGVPTSATATTVPVPPVVATEDGPMCMLPPATSSTTSSNTSIYKPQDDQLPPDWAGDLCVTCSS